MTRDMVMVMVPGSFIAGEASGRRAVTEEIEFLRELRRELVLMLDGIHGRIERMVEIGRYTADDARNVRGDEHAESAAEQRDTAKPKAPDDYISEIPEAAAEAKPNRRTRREGSFVTDSRRWRCKVCGLYGPGGAPCRHCEGQMFVER